jgi:hypothetical protein
MKTLFSSKAFSWIVIGAVVIAVVYGITLAGSPGEQRLLQFDQRRVSDLQQISYAVERYWQLNEEFPASLEDLTGPQYGVFSLVDPKTQEPYMYVVIGEREYELCAVFETDTSLTTRAPKLVSVYGQSWDHGIGQTCFEFQVQKIQ